MKHQSLYNSYLMEDVQICDGCSATLNGHRVEGMGEVSLLQCECGLVITSPRPSPEELDQYYPPTYYSYLPKPPTLMRLLSAKLRTYKGGYPSGDGPIQRTLWRVAASLFGNFFLFYLPYRGAARILLEVGCGTGSDLDWARQHGWDVHGLELSEGAVKIARENGLDVQRSTFEGANLSANSFDCILMSQVLEHLYSPKLALRRCHEILRPGGLLLIAVPKFDSWTRHALGSYWHNLQFPVHLHHFNQPVLERMIRDAGFQVREVRLSSRLLNLAYALRTMKRFRIFRRIFTKPQGTLSDVMLIVAEK
ncbi:MAG: class I SAM-dependent methyltransferase [Candidatus Sulfotelmatobacter sp.]